MKFTAAAQSVESMSRWKALLMGFAPNAVEDE